ncbi:hypothetical protein [Streptomyces sp. Z26]|uniref:hypothetical protein n=1 Tax=Streptomyces sp. Z26 TaxID=2500177 RepID=UPI000EF15CE5|nr:hypothetical protein [Streptomyces sp. Z26]RLL67003.1 hypothetical protein D7M15_09135 [Streptomyces sp. Z26]
MGAAIGGGLAGLTAVGTGLFGLRQAHLQLKHQESEAARQRRFESLTERRGPRSQAYAEFVAAGQDLIDALYGQEQEFHEQFQGLWEAIRKRRSTVAIAGPDFVVKAAGQFSDEVRSFRNDLAHGRISTNPLNEKHRLERRLDSFTQAARTALEDEGH